MSWSCFYINKSKSFWNWWFRWYYRDTYRGNFASTHSSFVGKKIFNLFSNNKCPSKCVRERERSLFFRPRVFWDRHLKDSICDIHFGYDSVFSHLKLQILRRFTDWLNISFMKIHFEASNCDGVQLIFLGCISELISVNLLHE